MVTEQRRAQYEKLRMKIFEKLDELELMLDADGHAPECVLRCTTPESAEPAWAWHDHACPVCGDDE